MKRQKELETPYIDQLDSHGDGVGEHFIKVVTEEPNTGRILILVGHLKEVEE